VVQVKVRENESLNQALKRFKKKFEKEGILKAIKKNTYYIKPTERRRLKRAKAIKRLKKLERKERRAREKRLRLR